jgi:hypothetical protein
MKTNVAVAYAAEKTAEGGAASRVSDLETLKRSVLSCFLWEDNFYENGKTIAERIKELTSKVKVEDAVSLMKQASQEYKLRHAPLWIAINLLNREGVTAEDIASIINRADSMTEILSLYWLNGKIPLSHRLKNAIGIAFKKFNEYSLAKYDRNGAIKLRDVLRIARPKPDNQEQSNLWKRVVSRTLATPDTWETELSAGKDKKSTWERLITEKKLGDLAFLRNLRNMYSVGVSNKIIEESFKERTWKNILPYQFLSAAKYVPQFIPRLDEAMSTALKSTEKLMGRTAILVDVSGSMNSPISLKSDLSRWDTAIALSMLLNGVCEKLDIFQFNTNTFKVQVVPGFALKDKFKGSQGSTRMWDAIRKVGADYDRVIVITDEQTEDNGTLPEGKAHYYILNVSSNKNGVAYEKRSTHISGFSEASVKYILEFEKQRKEE